MIMTLVLPRHVAAKLPVAIKEMRLLTVLLIVLDTYTAHVCLQTFMVDQDRYSLIAMEKTRATVHKSMVEQDHYSLTAVDMLRARVHRSIAQTHQQLSMLEAMIHCLLPAYGAIQQNIVTSLRGATGH
eukprot:1128001_1